ncbi:MAG: hypothetical protein IPN29_15245 [Saprospiraceae bacterium]|nr:hypothetical protein [Saprospiraceae bacterium]
MAQSLPFDGQWLQENDLGTAQNLNIPFEEGVSQKNWKLDVGAGLISGPYVTQLKDVFKSIDLQGCYNTFFGQECYPKQKIAMGFMASLSRKVSGNISLGATVNKSYIFGVEGSREGQNGEIGSRILSIAPMLGFSLKNNFFLGVGPAYHDMSVRFSKGIDLNLAETTPFKKVGFILDAGWLFPAEGFIYIKVNLRYLYAGAVEIGPYQISPQVEFPKSTVSFNQIFLSFGGGFRW